MENLEKQSSIHDKITFMILFSILTLGMYIPFWIYKKRNFFNNLNSNNKISNSNTNLLLSIFAIHTIVVVLTSFFNSNAIFGSGTYDNLIFIQDLFLLLSIIFLLYVCFKMSRIINDHFNVRNSVIGIILFTVFYFQYKINILTKSNEINTSSSEYGDRNF